MIIVTGGSDGLGAQLVHLAKNSGQETVNVSRRSNVNATINIKADLSKVADITATTTAIRKLSNVSTLVLNAGVFSLQKLCNIEEQEYKRVMDINLRAPLLIVAQLIDWIIENEVDVVVVNSIAGMRSFKEQTIYDISKWGLRGFTEDLRLELSSTRCRVIAVYPGMLDTTIAEKLPTGPLPKSKNPTISSRELARIILDTIQLPKTMQLSDIVIDRKV